MKKGTLGHQRGEQVIIISLEPEFCGLLTFCSYLAIVFVPGVLNDVTVANRCE